MKVPMYLCKYFDKCSAPICPLDEFMSQRTYVKGELKCTLDKRSRKRLGVDLPNKGLLPTELRSLKAWKSRSEKSKTETLKKLVKFGSKNS